MKLEKENIIVERSYKKVYKCEEGIVKVFEESHPKSNVFNEALNQVRAEETGLDVAKVISVSQVDGKWALLLEYKEGKTLAELMKENPDKMEEYMEKFVDLQLEIHSKKAPLMNKLKDKLVRQINGLTALDATQKYELLTRLDGMPKHTKVCHGDFNPTNVIVAEDGTMTVVDWAHATQGNAGADVAMTYLLFALKDQNIADLYLKIFCKKTDTAKQYVEKWLPIVAAAQLEKENALEKDFLMKWVDVCEYQ